MKNLNEMLQYATKLNKQEMKKISGGMVGSSNCCAYNTDATRPGFTCINGGGNQQSAQFMATENGWWACNSDEVVKACCR
ncbi:MAG: hypothetical protein K2P54_09065 [Odoribacter sp.]|nr:hypothetical protein [Odoribacter sp.]